MVSWGETRGVSALLHIPSTIYMTENIVSSLFLLPLWCAVEMCLLLLVKVGDGVILVLRSVGVWIQGGELG